MNELEALKAAHAKLQREYDALLRAHILHQLVAMEMAGIRPKMRGLH